MERTTRNAMTAHASGQHALITRRQLYEHGLDCDAVDHDVCLGVLTPLTENVFSIAGAARTDHRRVMAACLDVGGVASHRTAAWLHGLVDFPCPSEVEVTVAKDAGSNRTTLGRVHTSTNCGDDIIDVDGIPTLSVARTLLSLGALVPNELSMDRLVAAVEDAVRTRKATDSWLWWMLERRRCRGRNGVRAFEAVLAERAALGPTESWLEREMLRLIERAGLPRPTAQRTFRARGRFVSRVDFVYERERVVVEVDGSTHADRTQRSIDARQANELQLLGYRVLRFTYDQVVRESAQVVRTIAAALASPAAA